MDEKEKPRTVFPPEYSYLEDSLRVTQGKLQEIDQRVANLPQDRNHRLNFKPPGDYKTNDRGKQLSRREELERDKQQVIKEYKSSIDNRLKFATPEQAAKVREIVAYQLEENPYKNVDRRDLKTSQQQEKPFAKSFDYMASVHYTQYGTLPPPLKEHESKIHAPKYDVEKIGDRFLKQLRYPEKKEITEESLTQSKEKAEITYESLIDAKEREKPDLDKE